ncbi:MAG: PEP-CTERM sorting domain-containing protein [Geobacteraceae bacterium]|nr:PEP-CTERM sorting domain-containing protein [Geobacteraceae bacterium]
MKKVIVALALCLVAATAQATVLTFDELNGQDSLPSNYAGLTWGSGWDYYDWSQDPYNPASAPVRVYNNYGDPSVGFATPSVFDGAYFAGSGTASYSLYLDNQLVYTSGAIYLSAAPTWLASGYSQSVDYVHLNVSQGSFVMDNFTFNEGSAPVPEPSTFILLGAGLAGLAYTRKRFAKK